MADYQNKSYTAYLNPGVLLPILCVTNSSCNSPYTAKHSHTLTFKHFLKLHSNMAISYMSDQGMKRLVALPGLGQHIAINIMKVSD